MPKLQIFQVLLKSYTSLFVVCIFLLKYLNSAHNFHMQNTNTSLKSMSTNSATLSVSEFVLSFTISDSCRFVFSYICSSLYSSYWNWKLLQEIIWSVQWFFCLHKRNQKLEKYEITLSQFSGFRYLLVTHIT